MRDLYEKHPNKPGFMRLCGRTDDIISFSTGEKFNPVTFESMVLDYLAVSSALVAGHGKFQASLLVEPRESPVASEERLLDDIWPTVQAANEASPAHAQISKDHIIFTNPDKPIPLTGKGTVKRMLTLELYKDEIDNLYIHKTASETRPANTPKSEENNVRGFLYRIISDETGCKEIGFEENFLEKTGLDSVQVENLTRNINKSVSLFQPKFTRFSASTLYDNPSIVQLAAILKESGGLAGLD